MLMGGPTVADAVYFRALVKEILKLKVKARDSEMTKTLKGIGRQSLAAVGGTVVGGLVAGPVGGFLGANAASVVSYYRVHKYKSLVANLRQLDDDQKQEVVRRVQGVVDSVSVDDLKDFMSSQDGRDAVVKAVRLVVKVRRAARNSRSSSSREDVCEEEDSPTDECSEDLEVDCSSQDSLDDVDTDEINPNDVDPNEMNPDEANPNEALMNNLDPDEEEVNELDPDEEYP